MLDEADAEFLLVTLRMANRSTASVYFANDKKKGEARIANQWVEAEDLWDGSHSLAPHKNTELALVAPAGTEACRLNLNYQSEELQWRLWRILGRRGQQAAARVLPVKLAGRLWPNTRSLRRSRYATLTLEVALPSKSSPPTQISSPLYQCRSSEPPPRF